MSGWEAALDQQAGINFERKILENEAVCIPMGTDGDGAACSGHGIQGCEKIARVSRRVKIGFAAESFQNEM